MRIWDIRFTNQLGDTVLSVSNWGIPLLTRQPRCHEHDLMVFWNTWVRHSLSVSNFIYCDWQVSEYYCRYQQKRYAGVTLGTFTVTLPNPSHTTFIFRNMVSSYLLAFLNIEMVQVVTIFYGGRQISKYAANYIQWFLVTRHKDHDLTNMQKIVLSFFE